MAADCGSDRHEFSFCAVNNAGETRKQSAEGACSQELTRSSICSVLGNLQQSSLVKLLCAC